jgi:hypothetical protein
MAGRTVKVGVGSITQCSTEGVFSDSVKGVLVDKLHLGAEPGAKGDEQVFSCRFDCIGFDAYQLFRVSRMARVWWRPD